ncbi:hypothetical protein [Streptomyces atratus]|uniref:hypothetical protein n=1 Tax=Streptomyces atratus TaxID=1893 RepID=UPI00224E9566|nr:hypothetical protein [Streptomyces atratus]MCX5345827.1 hypothetical protein [Streptomyces atratus]
MRRPAACRGPARLGPVLGAAGGAFQRCGQASVGSAEDDFGEGPAVVVQLALHQTRAAYEQYATTLPWSAEPMPGWESDKQLHSNYISAKPDSPGYTEEQTAEVAQFQAELLRLSTEVVTHPYWQSLSGPDLVDARMVLQHAHESVEDEAA